MFGRNDRAGRARNELNPGACNPAPDPSQGTIVYDGQCGFCRGRVAWIQARAAPAQFECLPRQTNGIEQRFPQLMHSDLSTGLRFIHTDGRVAVGPDAVYAIARQLPGWRRIAWLYRVPLLHQVWRALYAWIARNRQRLPGAPEPGNRG